MSNNDYHKTTSDNTSFYDRMPDWSCEKCGGVNRGEAAFCRYCGSQRPSVEPRYTDSRYDEARYSEMPQKKNDTAKWVAVILGLVLVIAVVSFFTVKMIMDNRSDNDKHVSDDTTQSYHGGSEDNGAGSNDDANNHRNDPAPTTPSNDSGSNSNPNNSVPTTQNNDSNYKVGESYYVQDVIKVRYGPGKEYEQMKRNELASEEYAISVKYKDEPQVASLKKGSKVICRGMSEDGEWMQLTKGWICVVDNGERLVR